MVFRVMAGAVAFLYLLQPERKERINIWRYRKYGEYREKKRILKNWVKCLVFCR